jgi:hypothetical protein
VDGIAIVCFFAFVYVRDGADLFDLLSLASNRASGLILTFRGILDFFRENFVLIFSRASNLREVTTLMP